MRLLRLPLNCFLLCFLFLRAVTFFFPPFFLYRARLLFETMLSCLLSTIHDEHKL